MNLDAAWRDMRLALIAPHPDDVAYSIGGLAAACAAHSSLELITVFTRSAWALPKSLRLAGPEAITAVRRHEDMSFCRRLNMRLHTLDMADSSMSGYDDDSELTAEIDADPRRLEVVRRLRRLLISLAPDVVLAPAAVGGHVDHRIVHEAIRQLHGGAWQLVFYEDLPYAFGYTLLSLETALSANGLRSLATVDIDRTMDIKMAALWDYVSQTEPDTVKAIVAHARRLAAELPGEKPRHAEKLWEQI